MRNIIHILYHNRILSRLFPTVVHCLIKELGNCRTVLDLGCGPDSPLQYCGKMDLSIGVEAFQPYITKSSAKKIHHKYLHKKVEDLYFPENSFDAVIMIELLEHLPAEAGLLLLEKAEKWAAEKVIVTTPNGFLPQKNLDGNELQQHLSGWTTDDFKTRGFSVYGLSGLKVLRRESGEETMGDNVLGSIRFSPKFLWMAIATLSQMAVYRLPELAFELFCVKKV